jgi:hypothetical protein
MLGFVAPPSSGTGIARHVRAPDEADVLALVADPACPAVVALRRAPVPARLVFVRPFLDFAESRDFARGETERAMDEAVTRLGGDRQDVRNPALRMRNLVRAMRRREPLPQEEVWFLPTQTFESPS